ncbi:GPN-loop GTPase 2 [Neocloeon triangulifer]|uniref:GPN-loop GTPase 2 n=1 Tax=Neocloeon triangulifer TaxID=2078957 RepID=UPI00286ED749|nr:GPN-loop GTPase 2 [Neocloeon triangulifer]
MAHVATTMFGQAVVGPPGSGKSSYCKAMGSYLRSIGRKVAIVNLDPANDTLPYEGAIDITELVTLEDTMSAFKLGPNGGLMYCMEFIEKNIDWLLEKISALKDHYFLLDFPGQVELYTHHNSAKNILSKLVEFDLRLCSVQLVDSHHCSDPGKFISALLLSLTTMLHTELPHINILSKIDLAEKYSSKLDFGLDFYTDVLNLDYLLQRLDEQPGTKKFKKLNAALVGLIEGYNLVSFLPMSVSDKKTLCKALAAADKANGCVFGTGEPRNIQSLLACATGAVSEQERLGEFMDEYS